MDTVVVTSAYRVEAGQVLEFKYTDAFLVDARNGAVPSLTIAGSVRAYLDAQSPIYGGSLYGIIFSYEGNHSGVVRIESGGSLTVSHTAGASNSAYGFYTQSHSADLFNAGLLHVVGNDATGVFTAEPVGFDLENRGQILSEGTGRALGVWLFNGGSLINSGRIDAFGSVDVAGVWLDGFGSNFENSGYIRAVGTNPDSPSIAVRWYSSFDPGQRFLNSGTLEGDYALTTRPWVDVLPNQVYEFVNTGSMIGKVRMSVVPERLINSGTITGSVELGAGDDLFDGRSGIQRGLIDGGSGADSLAGGSGADTLLGAGGSDTLSGGGGADVFLIAGSDGAEVDRILDWSADDRLRFSQLSGDTAMGVLVKISAADMAAAASQARSTIGSGQSGYVAAQVGGDVVVFSATDAVILAGRSLTDVSDASIVRYAAPVIPTSGTTGNDTVVLSNDPNTYSGWEGDDTVSGLLGADTLLGYEGNDSLSGGGGNDVLEGREGSNTISGGEGSDYIYSYGANNYLRGDEGNDYIVGSSAFDDINGNTGADTISGGDGDDWVVGGKDGDSLLGGEGNDLVYGNLGGDTCEGGDGNDIIRGGQDNDFVRGSRGDDWLSGDKGDDTMTGDLGADTFHTFGETGIDRVTDFSVAQGDRVLLDWGTQYTVAQVGADTVISMTGGGQMILVGVQMSSLTSGWIFGN